MRGFRYGLRMLALAILIPSAAAETVTRGPYLQMGTSTAMTVRWRTDMPSASRVTFGTDIGTLAGSSVVEVPTTEHVVRISGLKPDSQYFYTIGNSTTALAGAGDPGYSFVTAPPVGTPSRTRIWVIGDFGTGGAGQAGVRNAYAALTATAYTDAILMLGDNAYDSGQDQEYQDHVFAMYPALLRRSVAWPTIGNHDTGQAVDPPPTIPYFRQFTLPARGESGGMASGTPKYYAFDRANIHVVCLDSMTSDRSAKGAMGTWLAADLASTTQTWIIAFWHHPAYSKGTHDSDTEMPLKEMRENMLPILEAAGVDLVLSGHSHDYERSYLLDGHYGLSRTLVEAMKVGPGDGRPQGTGAYIKTPGAHHGAVYSTVGCSGAIGGGRLDHPAMVISLGHVYGSMVLEIEGQTLVGTFLNDQGAMPDTFSIVKQAAVAAPGAGSAP